MGRNHPLAIYEENKEKLEEPVKLEKIEILKDLRGLKYLNLSGTKISDKCFRQLEKVPDLKRLYVYGTPLTHKGVRRLNHYLPKCTVYHDAGVLRAKIAC